MVRATAVDLGPLRRSRDFRLVWAGQLVSAAGRQFTVVALPYQVYGLTRSAFAVGALGLVQLVPLLGASLVGGSIADRVDRRRLLLAVNLVLAACSAALALAAPHGPPLAFVYAMAALIAAFAAVEQPTRSAMVPNLVPRHQLGAALALMFGTFQVSLVAGPALAGVTIAGIGLGAAYWVDAVTFGAAIAGVWLVRPQPPAPRAADSTLRAIAGGLDHVRRQPVILGSFVADIDAMVFGSPTALFPVLAATTFGVGASGLGLLYSAPGVGAVAALVCAGPVSRAARKGRIVVLSIVAWGVAITLFGLTSRLWLALVLLAVAGGADAWSAVCRSTIMQERTPDHLRGRLSAIYSMVVVGGPRLGDLESGGVASLTTPAISVTSGGLLTLAGLAGVVAAFPQLWRARSEAPAAAAAPPRPAVAGTPDAGGATLR